MHLALTARDQAATAGPLRADCFCTHNAVQPFNPYHTMADSLLCVSAVRAGLQSAAWPAVLHALSRHGQQSPEGIIDGAIGIQNILQMFW